MNEKVIHVAFCTDSNYVMPTGVAMISICENNKGANICFHVVVTDDMDADKMTLKFVDLTKIAGKYGCECKLYPIESSTLSSFECHGVSHVSTAGFARVFIPDLLDKYISKVIYLDCDVVVNGSLLNLWETELEADCPFAAVADANGGSALYRRVLELPLKYEYFNSGVLLMNLDCWRRNSYTMSSIECASARKFPFLDQDMLNYMFAGRIKALPVKYNFQTLFEFTPEMYWMVEYKYVDEIRSIKRGVIKPIVIHYISSNKPWKDEWCPMREVWDYYKQLSPWKGLAVQSVITRFDRCSVYNDFMDAYWSDPKLMEEILKHNIALQNIVVRMKNKWNFVKFAMLPVRCFVSVLRFLYGLKTLHTS